MKFRAMMLDVKGAFSQLMVAITPLLNGLIEAAAKFAQFLEAHPNILRFVASFLSPAFGVGGKKEAAPTIGTSIDRLPTSPWERMGLVVGSSNGTNYAQKTAENTRRTNELLQAILGSSGYLSNPTSGIPALTTPRSGATSLFAPGSAAP
jgi:hypothetical protein